MDNLNSNSNDLSCFEILQYWSDKGYTFQLQRKVTPDGKVAEGFAIIVTYKRKHIGVATGNHFIGLVTIVESMLKNHYDVKKDGNSLS